MNSWFLLTSFLLAAVRPCQAQVQVSKEPMHHNVFENSWVRVLDVHIPPGDTSLMHKHSTPSVFLILTNTKTGSQAIVEPRKLRLTPGNIWFEGFYDTPRIHRVWNSDTTEFHVIDMELLNEKPRTIEPPLQLKSLTLLLDEKPVRGYRFALAAQSTTLLSQRNTPIMVIGLTNTGGNVTANSTPFVKKGDFMFVQPGSSINFINKGSAGYEFALFELK